MTQHIEKVQGICEFKISHTCSFTESCRGSNTALCSSRLAIWEATWSSLSWTFLWNLTGPGEVALEKCTNWLKDTEGLTDLLQWLFNKLFTCVTAQLARVNWMTLSKGLMNRPKLDDDIHAATGTTCLSVRKFGNGHLETPSKNRENSTTTTNYIIGSLSFSNDIVA